MKSLFLKSVVSAIALCLMVGCNSEPAAVPVQVGAPPDDAHLGHEHAHEGPHHGQLIELGQEEYHAELAHDDATHTVTIYVLDGAAEKSVPIDLKEVLINLVVDGKPQQFTLPAAAQEGEPEGKSSRFQLVSQELCEALDTPKATGRLNLTIADKPFVGQIEGHDHAHSHN